MLTAIWKQVDEEREKGKNLDEIIQGVTADVGPKYRSLYKDFDSSIEYLVTMVHKKQT
jgi:hypothetical protein